MRIKKIPDKTNKLVRDLIFIFVLNKFDMKKAAIYILISMFSLILVFHFLVVLGVIPYSIVWGGRLENTTQMYWFEANSILMTILFLFTVLLKAKLLKFNISEKLVNGVLWFMFVLFVLNTVGNLFSKNSLEKMIMTPQTILLAVLILIVLLKKDKIN